MDWNDTPEQAAFRAEVKGLIDNGLPDAYQGGKGELLNSILAEFDPSVTVFVDDLGHQHGSVAKHAPDVWRLQMVGEPIMAKHIKTNPAAHARIDSWSEAVAWISDKFEQARPAPETDLPSQERDPANHA